MSDDKSLIEYQVEQHEETIKEHESILQKHETKIQKLEDSDLRTQLQISEIQKSQMKIELLIIENSNNQSKTLNEFTKTMIDTFAGTIKNNNKTNNKMRLVDRKEFWGFVIALVGILSSVVTYLVKIN